MNVRVKRTEDEVRRELFVPNIEKAASKRGYAPTGSGKWDELSELRLFSKIMKFKPAGVNRRFMMGNLVHYMNNIYEDETDIDFEQFLSPSDFAKYQGRKETFNKPDIMIFKPSYKIRPNSEQIMAKLNELFSMEVIERNEYLPDAFTEQSDFSIPESYQMKREGRATSDKLVPSISETTPSAPSDVAVAKRKPRKTPSSTRSNTPAVKEK